MSEYATMDTDEDMTYPDTRTHAQKVVAQLAKLELEMRKLTERVAHNEVWLHKLLNPNADADPSQQPTLLDLQDGF